MTERIIILDFGSQYTQLIARRVRELNVYCEIHPFNKIPKIDSDVKGVILSGSPFSVRDVNSPRVDLNNIEITIVGSVLWSSIHGTALWWRSLAFKYKRVRTGKFTFC